jgi:hypothetical protein
MKYHEWLVFTDVNPYCGALFQVCPCWVCIWFSTALIVENKWFLRIITIIIIIIVTILQKFFDFNKIKKKKKTSKEKNPGTVLKINDKIYLCCVCTCLISVVKGNLFFILDDFFEIKLLLCNLYPEQRLYLS